MSDFLFTSESVSEGHPDKMCDLISDAILDAYLTVDPESRVACETLVTTDRVIVAGEITSKAEINVESVVRRTIRDIGYNDPKLMFSADTCEVTNLLHEQSPDISQGVTEGEGEHKEQGAGDQGIMFGYATNETDSYMPFTLDLSHKFLEFLAERRKGKKDYSWVRPDSKAQVTIRYSENYEPLEIVTFLVSTQHAPEHREGFVKEKIENLINEFSQREGISKKEKALWENSNPKILVNPTGKFEIGGPHGDSGLTGRKIIVDTYGGWGSHGGGAFSGKDPSKVDRSAAYAARQLAKSVVANGIAERCSVQLSYAIGMAEPISINVNTFGTTLNGTDDRAIEKLISEKVDLKPASIINNLKLKQTKYFPSASYGHFGRKSEVISNNWGETYLFPWEEVIQLK